MIKIKEKIKNILLEYTVRYVPRSKILNRTLNSLEKEAVRHIYVGFLRDIGWWDSWKEKLPMDKQQKPLPWVTYSFINFIDSRLNKNMMLFEYGSGNSTLYYSTKVKEVHTVEHDLDWFEKMKHKLPNNVKINHVVLESDKRYCRYSQESGIKYDIIIVDGRDRVNCLINAMTALSKGGILILDDSEREIYKKGIDKLTSAGFRSLDFWGISPGFIAYNKCTSIYYMDENVLNI